MLTRYSDIRLYIQVSTARGQVHSLCYFVFVLRVFLSGNHVNKLHQVYFFVMNDFVPLISFKQLLDSLGNQKLNALAGMFRCLHFMFLRTQTRMGKVQQLVVQLKR